MATTAGYSQSSAGSPEWYNQYLADMSATAGALAQEEYTPYAGPRIADWTTDQQAGFAGIRDAQGMWQPGAIAGGQAMDAGVGGLNAMSQMTQQAGQWNQPAYDRISGLYQQPLQDMQAAANSIGQRNFQNTTLKGLNDNFTGAGQFGSGRHQLLGADAAAQAQAQIEEAKASMGVQAVQNSLGDYMRGQQQMGQMGGQMGTYAADQARMGTDLMNYGMATQHAALGDAGSMMELGKQQQGMDQNNLNLAYQDFKEQEQYPWQQLNNWGAVTKGQTTPSNQSSISFPQTQAPVSSNPWLSGLSGAGGGWQLASSF